ncbi:MAG: RNA polymerase sigma-54 factor [Betaproteobacteria bacterium]|nr:RNA polymerase sigma-54 factor [Betaproteobacteria bacterium]
MAFELKQGLKLGQTLVLSPQIQQAIKILTLGRQELEELVAEELRQNPCLEEGENTPENTEAVEFDTQINTEKAQQENPEKEVLPDIDELLSRFRELPGEESLQRENSENEFDSPSYERLNLTESNLHDSLEDQLRLMHLTEYELDCATFLLQYLDDNGFFKASIDELAREQNIPPDDLRYALKAIQKCEPAGVGASGMQECLLLQLRQKKNAPKLAERILKHHWDDFEKQDISKILRILSRSSDSIKEAIAAFRKHHLPKFEGLNDPERSIQEQLLTYLREHERTKAKEQQFLLQELIIRDFWKEFEANDDAKITRALVRTPEDVKEALVFIREELDPRPARQFGGGQDQVISPDVFIFRRNNEWVVSLNEDGLPRLKISPKYENMIKAALEGKKSDSGTEINQPENDKSLKEFVNDNIKTARAFVKALADRNKTILRVTEVILDKQKAFFEEGPEHLKPLTLKAVAEDLGLHESTISRTTNNKYMHTPQGLFELKHFFNSGMSTDSGGELANEVVKSWVAECIKAESEQKPFSDQDISDWIQSHKNVKVARRTVAKYRESLGILPSSKRVRRF